VITVGNFDGGHRGHQALVAEARRMARDHEATEVVAVTFRRHPLTVLKPERAPTVLTDPVQKEAALRAAGVDRVEWLEPDSSVLGLEPRDFVDRIAQRHRPVAWLEGPDFRFGRKRAGDLAKLRSFGEEFGFEVREVTPVEITLRDKLQYTISSSLIRRLIACGRVVDAELCLGRPYAFPGRVVEGERRGSEIGFPTANLDPDDRQMPADGVYAGTVEIDGTEYATAVSVGVKPTFGEASRAFEAYILDYEGDLYGRTLEVHLRRWMRDQWNCPSLEVLLEQMERDVAAVRRLHRERLLGAAEMAAASQ